MSPLIKSQPRAQNPSIPRDSGAGVGSTHPVLGDIVVTPLVGGSRNSQNNKESGEGRGVWESQYEKIHYFSVICKTLDFHHIREKL